jgi:hypothetical protein
MPHLPYRHNSMHKTITTRLKCRVIKTQLSKGKAYFIDNERSLMKMEIYMKSNAFKF